MAEYLSMGIQGRDMNTMCRLCLGENVELLHVFELKGIPGWTAANAINELLRIEISEGDIYPKFICTECMGKLTDFKLFKNQCEINKDSLELQYRRHREVGDNEAVAGTVVCSSDKNTEVYIKQEYLEILIEKDPLELSEEEKEEDNINAEMEESSNGNDEIPSAEVIGSAYPISQPIKCELEDEVSSVDANEIIIPDITSTTEVLQLKQGHNASESALTESIKMKGFINERCLSSDVHSIGPENDSRGHIGVSALSRVGGNFGNDEEVPKSIPSSSHNNRVHGSCNSSHNLESERETIIVSPCHDEHSIVSKYHDQEKIIANEKVFACVKCFEKFPTPDLLRSHSVIHSSQDLFQVPGCSKSVRQQSNLKTNMQIVSEGRIFACSECCETFPHKKRLKEHLFYSGDIPFVCNLCSLTFYCKNQLKYHITTHSLDYLIHCTMCSEVFLDEDELELHTSVHADEKRFKCKQCSKSFSRKSDVNRHIKIHTGERSHKCDQCGKSFSRDSYLKTHLKAHTGERPYQCYLCNKSFFSNSALNVHIRIHTGERPYECNECDKCFSDRGQLNKHKRTHSGEKPYQCDQCGATFSENSNYKRHLRVHSGERRYQCNLCHKNFYTNGDLKRHLRIHSGQRPYECKHCGKSFTQRGTLKSHVTTHNLLTKS